MTTRFRSRAEWLDSVVGRRQPEADRFRSADTVNLSGLFGRLAGGEWVEVSRAEWLALPTGYELTNRADTIGRDHLYARRVPAFGVGPR